MTKKVIAIAAADSQWGIGRDGLIPWHLPSELQRVSRITRQVSDPHKMNALVMGRITYDSIPPHRRPLKGRVNIVVSRRLTAPTPVVVAGSVASAIDYALQEPRIESVFIFGGETIYREAFKHKHVDEVLLSTINHNFGCDRFFPDLPTDFTLAHKRHETYDGVQVTHCTYHRDDPQPI